MTKEEREVMQMALQDLKEIHAGNMTPMAEINWNKAIKAIEKCLANDALEKKAKNAKELGLEY